ncbi:hypothetical protein KGF56_000972 [Candida oxycetoniae]|uniref:RNA helicase n=1 Tax=Candida oxycetoniae TaxID=497107 RepID=A0AAI9WZQ0_9ASCO|nr:uncharacterized protein KGF56_000972 [Candida oxycetoniae]KAI3406130.2 hypothetical protein KGF56_000972 [Candida oxycetoniae]
MSKGSMHFTGKGFSRKRAFIDYDDTRGKELDAGMPLREDEADSQQSAAPPIEMTEPAIPIEESNESLLPPPPQERRYEKRRRNYPSYIERLQLQVEELESRSYLEPLEQSKLESLQDKLEYLQNQRPDAQYQVPQSTLSKAELLHGKQQQQQQKQRQQQQQQQQQQSFRTVNWETEQFNRAKQLHLQTDEKIHVNDDKEYEYVFDESQFVNYEENEILSGDEVEENGGEENEQQEVDLQTSEQKDIEQVQQSLPVFKYKQEFVKVIKENQIVIIVGETGSGKTTQLPQYLYEAGYSYKDTKKIGCTQPRRVAATSVAQRVAQEMHVPLGDKVGYTVRFDDKSSRNTTIKYLTDGMLLREFLNDPHLSSYGAIMIDEAHERTLSTELLLSLLKDLTSSARKDLKVIIASATINATKFSDFFNKAPILNIPGRRFPVKIHYTKQPEANYIQAIIITIFQIHLTQPLPGDILVFLTGQEEIEKLEQQIQESITKLGGQLKEHGKLLVCSIFANLPPEYQQRIFEPTPPFTRKIVLATNIAETSITIPGVSYVIDPGYVKQTEFNPQTGMESLLVVPCSKANCDQRAGRAGRVGPGKCFRIFTKHSFDNEMELNMKPEIKRTNLNSVVLLLLSLGINDLIKFPFLDPPKKQSLIKSLNLLYSLGALNSKGMLTKTGLKMSEFPLDPTYTKCILTSEQFGISKQICIIIAMLIESSNLYYIPKKLDREVVDKRHEEFIDVQGDHLTLLNIYKKWETVGGYSSQWCQDYFIQYKTMRRVRNIYEQLIKICRKIGIQFGGEGEEKETSNDSMLIQKCLLSGFFNNIVKLSPMGDCYQSVHSYKNKIPCFIHPSSTLYKRKNPKPRFMMYYELVLTSKEYMRNCLIMDDRLVKDIVKGAT